MNKLHVLGLTVVLSLLASMAFASPMILGGTGGLILPDTKTAQGIQLGVGKIMDNEDEWNNLMWPVTQLQIGVMKNLEVGVVYASDGSDSITQMLNAKYAFPLLGFDFALGLQIGDDDANVIYDGGNAKLYYAVASKTFDNGIMAAISANAVKLEDSATTVYPGLLIEKTLESGTKIGAELLFGKKDNPIYYSFDGNRFGNVYVEVPVDKQLAVKGGIIGIGDSFAENGLWLGATYAFGKNILDK